MPAPRAGIIPFWVFSHLFFRFNISCSSLLFFQGNIFAFCWQIAWVGVHSMWQYQEVSGFFVALGTTTLWLIGLNHHAIWTHPSAGFEFPIIPFVQSQHFRTLAFWMICAITFWTFSCWSFQSHKWIVYTLSQKIRLIGQWIWEILFVK